MKPSMLGLLIAAGAFGASTIYLAMQLQDERARADEVLEQTRTLNARIVELERARAELESLQLTADLLAGPAMPAGKSEPAATFEIVAHEPQSASAEAPARTDPGNRPERSEAMQKMMRTQMRANFKRLHSDIGEKLGLGKDETNKLIDLLIEQQMGLMGRGRADRGRTPEQQEKNLADVAALIGADKMEAYKAYQESMPARQEVDMLSRQLDANDLGLSKDQRDRLVTALAQERQRIPAPKLADSYSREEFNKAMSAWQDDYNQRAVTRAGSILTGDQQNAYSEYQQWTKEMRQQFEARRAARSGGGPGGPPGSMPRAPRQP
jgi:hypothetical protein